MFVQRRGKKGPGKRSQHALRRKDEIEGRKRSPFGVNSRPVKHFDELKFYHARNKYGQKQTLVDSRRRDIEFFNPVSGGYDKDPRSRYEESGSDAEFNDEEAKLYADFTDTDDEDIYFGGGNDQDGDYDDAGNELRPKPKKKETWADADRVEIEEEATDPDEEEREFNEVFGKGIRTNEKTSKQRDDDAEFVADMKMGAKQGDFRRRRNRDFPYSGGVISDKRSMGNKFKNQRSKIDFSKPDPELGIDEQTFKQTFKKKDEMKPVLEKGFSPDEFLKEDGLSSDGGDSEWDEEEMVKAGDEEMEELIDVSDMIRDYDRTERAPPVTEAMAEQVKKEEMESGEFYESDDVEIPHVEDPKMQREIAEEHDENVRRLKSTPGGRMSWKTINRENEWMEDFPKRDRRAYQDALRMAPHDGAPPMQRKEFRGDRQPKGPRNTDRPRGKVKFPSRHDPISRTAPSKSLNSWRTMSAQFEEEAEEEDFMPRKKQGKPRRPFPNQQNDDRRQFDQRGQSRQSGFRGRRPFGGSGVRFYSTSPDISSTAEWMEQAKEVQMVSHFRRKLRRYEVRAIARATSLRRYWSRFPSDNTVQAHCAAFARDLKIRGTVFVAMTLQRRLMCGVAAPGHTFKGNGHTFKETPFVKLDLKSFRKMKQRGEIVTGGPQLKQTVEQRTCDWTGTVW